MTVSRTDLAGTVVLWALLSAVAPAAHQSAAPQAPPTGLVIGRIADGVSNAPVTGTIVTLSGAGIRPRRVLVDSQGRFMFVELPAGTFTITATHTGFLDGAFGRVRPGGASRQLDLTAGEHVTDIVVKMWRTGSISGVITDDSGDPVPYTRVQALTRNVVAGHWRYVTSTFGGDSDDRGAYRIAGLPPGEYALVITSMNTSIPASLISAADAERRSPSGLLNDLRAKGTMGLANDLVQGFPALKVGEFMLQTSADRTAPYPGHGPIEVYPTVWYPASATANDASVVTIAAGEDRTGVDLHPVLTKTRRVSGTVTGPDGPVSFLAVGLVPAGLDQAAAEITSSLALSFNTARSATDANGAFTFLAVPPGQYIIRVLTTPPPLPEPTTNAPSSVLRTSDGMSTVVAGAALPPLLATEPTYWAGVPVTVGAADVTGVVVTLRPGLRVTGAVEFAGTSARPDGNALRSIRLRMDPADGRTIALPSSYQAQIDPNGRFYTLGLVPGQYILRVETPPRGWSLKSAIVGGRDISDIPLVLDNNDVDSVVLTFTDRPSSLTGIVRNPQGAPDPDATVLVFPADGSWMDRGPNARRMQSVRASRTGSFTIAELPPGDYCLVAVNDAIVSNWQDPAFLTRLARIATRVTLADGQPLTATLTTVPRVER